MTLSRRPPDRGYTRDEIGAMSRPYILDVLFWERDRRGAPVFTEANEASAVDTLTARAVAKGIPHPHARGHAKRMIKGARKR